MRAIFLLFLLTSIAQAQTPVAGPSLDTLATALAATAQCAVPRSIDDRSYDPPPHDAQILINVAYGTHVSSSILVVSSGNPKFDQRAVSCLRAIAFAAPLSQRSAGVYIWVYSNKGAIAIQSDRPPQWAIEVPAAAGSRHDCSQFSAALRGRTGQTTLDFDITAKGAVTNVKIEQSSGNLELDHAAVECVSQWQFNPVMKDGIPSEASSKTIVKWDRDPNPVYSTVFFRGMECVRYEVQIADIQNASGPTVLQLTTHGLSVDVTIKTSSGNDKLDELARVCFETAGEHFVNPYTTPMPSPTIFQVAWNMAAGSKSALYGPLVPVQH